MPYVVGEQLLSLESTGLTFSNSTVEKETKETRAVHVARASCLLFRASVLGLCSQDSCADCCLGPWQLFVGGTQPRSGVSFSRRVLQPADVTLPGALRVVDTMVPV